MRLELKGGRVTSARFGWLLAVAVASASSGACSGAVELPEEPIAAAESAVSTSTPVGLALRVENGAGVPLQVRAGQTFYINQIDVRAAVSKSVDEGLASLATEGDFAGMQWGGLNLEDTDISGTPNPDGTWNRRRYYRDAVWMKRKSTITVEQLDANGQPLGQPVHLRLGRDRTRSDDDSFFIRRMRGIQWTHDCATPADCSGASQFEEEALLEVRHANDNKTPFAIEPGTTSLRLSWSLKSGPGWVIPVTQIASPTYDYGFSIDIDVLTPPAPDGTYAPGSDITFQATLRDGSGNRLHPPGALPSFFEAELLGHPTGIRYYSGFFEPTVVYYRRKHTEGFMIEQFVGPMQDTQAIHSVLDFGELVGLDVQNPAVPERDGFYAQAVMFPRGPDLFGGAFDPTHAGWFRPVSDTWTHHIPTDAKPGTYKATMKGRRAYMGEDVQFTKTISLQVGSTTPMSRTLQVGNCGSCHNGGGSLAKINHANPNLTTCDGCHAPLPIELQGPIYVRTHFIHSRSERVDAPKVQCSTCHLTEASIQRTSKSACLSCHKTYSAEHVAAFGPIIDPFVGGGFDSLSQCSTTCHTTHPGGGL